MPHRAMLGPRSAAPTVRRPLSYLAAMALGLLLLPSLALAAPTNKIVPSFVGGKLGGGTSIHLRLTTTYTAELWEESAVLHLPKGTGLGFTRLPKRDLCNHNILFSGRSTNRSACPKASRAGPVGSARLETVVGGQPRVITTAVYPVLIELHGGTVAIELLIDAPAPFGVRLQGGLTPTKDSSRHYAPQEFITGFGTRELVSGGWGEITDLSVTIGGSAKTAHGTQPFITMPKSCPKGGFAWSTEFPFTTGPEKTAAATSPCPKSGKAAAVTARAHVATYKTPFQCEKAFHTSGGREGCFNQLPGANCAHPLEAQKAGSTTRGEHRYFKLSYSGEPDGSGSLESYSYQPASKNVAICPYPNGVVLKVSKVSDRQICGRVHGQEECTTEYDTHNHPEPTTRSGGSFEYVMPPVPWEGYLVVKGYFIHPPWGRGR